MPARNPASRTMLAASGFLLTASLACESRDSSSANETVPEGLAMNITLTSTAFAHNQPIPRKHTGDGDDLSPPLSWSGVPDQARELVLICDDPDAPTPRPWVHWVLYKVPATTPGLPEGVPTSATLASPAGALQGRNSWGAVGYRGPAPPRGHGVHHYHFKLYALAGPLDAASGLEKEAVLAKMKGLVLAEGELIGTYQR
jgi:Raf kinase inhibitor-like YbhB/YbcL family protein